HTTPLVDVRSYRYHGVASSFKFASTSSLTGLEEASPFHNIRAELCVSTGFPLIAQSPRVSSGLSF
ncbi:MAG: hypothetical protein ABSH01_18560, partial [Terriglobia bacterium]